MRKLNLTLFYATMLFVSGCGVNNPNNTLPDIELANLPNITIKNNFLNFESVDDFSRTLEILEKSLESYDDKFMSGKDEMSIDEIEKLEAKLKYNEFTPLVEFEKKFSEFNSLRSDLESKTEKWLSNKDLELSINEGEHFIDNEALLALVNENGEIAIEGVIYKIFSNGVAYAITNGDISTLAKIKDKHAASEFKSDQVKINDVSLLENNKAISNCTFSKSSIQWVTPSKDRKIQYKISVGNIFFLSWYSSKSINYKKNRRGKWKRRRAPMKCSLENEVSELCDPNFNSIDALYVSWSPYLRKSHDNFKRKRSRRISKFESRFYWQNVTNSPVNYAILVAENGKLKGNNTVDSYTKRVILTW
jgi:hypothetical protein